MSARYTPTPDARSYAATTSSVSITADGDYEVSFGTAATVALTPDAAEKFFWLLSTRIPELRRVAGAFTLD
ncbi:hypothetical protein [Saccharothrix carnea]|uniref:hypothetical protein n=1 Tax=Saccharothrix carnea TaxID=1280637 RepID=UPI000D0CF03B|nr:hypothetical protein [Saccharothrix carnea]